VPGITSKTRLVLLTEPIRLKQLNEWGRDDEELGGAAEFLNHSYT
jgi:hypothetical protein